LFSKWNKAKNKDLFLVFSKSRENTEKSNRIKALTIVVMARKGFYLANTKYFLKDYL